MAEAERDLPAPQLEAGAKALRRQDRQVRHQSGKIIEQKHG